MDKKTLQSDGLLLITAVIWGSAFVAQRVGMDYVGPFTYNGIRFALGGLSLIPLMIYQQKTGFQMPRRSEALSPTAMMVSGILIGTVLFAGASLQQVGLVYTTAGKAGFITGLYVVIVPILAVFIGQKSALGTWGGALLAAVGLYFLSVTESFTIQFGDLLEIIGAFFWSVHVLLLARFSNKVGPIRLAFIQFVICSVLSLITGLIFEVITLQGIIDAAVPILYGGLGSVGIAYTLQVVAQRYAHPAHAAILLSLETVFAALGGWLILDEILSTRALVGCALMFAGMIFSQLHLILSKKAAV
jgi:drug/metabolite transporter (DMT)-like permease